MRVILKNNLFTPMGFFRRSTASVPVDFPDELAHCLPKSAVIVEGGPVVQLKPVEPIGESLRDYDPLRHAEEEAQAVIDKAEEDARKVAERMAKARAARGLKKDE